jgi:3-hydroxyisobutyrate dehydrogenase-like beta-hydroxyacid dehydrogenase
MSASPALRVGFLGLGYMGHGMACNLLGKGFPLTVMAHRKREAVDALVGMGALEVHSPREMARRSDVVVICVTGAAEVDLLVRAPDGIASGAVPGTIIIDCTTSTPAKLLQLDADFRKDGLIFVDAPLGRSPKEAWAGKLSVMVGCDPPVLEQIKPVLSAFANSIQHVGVLGNGHTLKLVNNLISLGYAALYSEALVLARKAGLTTEAFDQLLRSSRMNCAFYDTFIGWALHGDPSSHRFALDTAHHSIDDIVGLSRSLGLEGGLAHAVSKIYRDAVRQGYGGAMLPELPRSVAEKSGIDIGPASGGSSRS